MSAFLDPLMLRALSAEECSDAKSADALFQLMGAFRYQSDKFGLIAVPAGFITDFASIPSPVLWYVDRDDPCIAFPSVIHDALYSSRGLLGGNFSREQSDTVLREAMLACGASWLQAQTVYLAVRTGGGSHWTP